MLNLQLLQLYDVAVPDRVVSLNISSDLTRIQLGNSYGDLRSITVGTPGFSEVHVSSHPLSNIIGDITVRDANGIGFQVLQVGQQMHVEKLFSGKNVSCVASDGINRIAVNSKKNLRVYKREGGKTWRKTHELELTSRMSAILMVFDDNVVCIGTPSQYSIFRLRADGTISVITLDHVPVSGIIPACEIVAQSGHIVLSTSSRLGIFVSYDGMPVPDRYPLEWSSAPLAIRLCSLCIVALLPGGHLEVFTIAHSHLVQTLSLGADCVISSRSFADSGFCVVDQNHIYIAKPMSFEDQIAYHVQYLHVNTAASILKSMNPSVEMVNALNVRLAKGLIKHLLFQEAFCCLEAVSEPVEPNTILSVLPVMDVPFLTAAPMTTTLESLIESGKRSISEGIDELSSHERSRTQLIQLTEEDTRHLLNEAYVHLALYFWKRRRSYENEALAIVDTVLLYLAVSVSKHQLPFSVEQLLLPSNACLPDFCEGFLLEKYPDVFALFLRSQSQFDEALRIWSQSRTNFASRSSVELLCSLGAEDALIFQYAEWVLENDRKQAPIIFHRCKPTRVISFLETLSNASFLVASYLEYLISDGCTEDFIHTLLAQTYLTLYTHSPKALLDFLQKSELYNASELLLAVNNSGLRLVQEQIIILSRLKAYNQVHQLYLTDLKDIDGAVRYTEKTRDPVAIIGLAQQLLDPSAESDLDRLRMQQIAIELLCRHGRDLDPVATLNLIPPDIPLVSVVSLLSRVINCTTSRRRLTQVELSLHSIERFRSETSLFEHQKRCIRVESSSLCRVCHRPVAGRPFSVFGSRLFHHQCK